VSVVGSAASAGAVAAADAIADDRSMGTEKCDYRRPGSLYILDAVKNVLYKDSIYLLYKDREISMNLV
jgi:hypothetical protein